jgi:hypothetical protein
MRDFFVLLIMGFLFLAGCSQPTSFFVSPAGDDRNAGTQNNPFATPQRAVQAVRQALDREKQSGITIYLSGGTYHLQEPLVFGPVDSGPDTFRIVYKAMPGEKPVISGGIEIGEWKSLEQNLWLARVPEIRDNHLYFRELFVNDRRAKRARHPNHGFNRIAAAGEDKRTYFYYRDGDFPLPEKPEDVELVLLHDWSITRIKIKELDSEKNKITAVDSIGAKSLNFFTLDNWEPDPRYFLENSITFLDEPYEWFLDRNAGLLYLYLPPGIEPGKCRVVAPLAEKLLLLEGHENDPVRNITFEGITFSHCAFILPESGYAGIQACHFDQRENGNTWNRVPSSVEGIWVENIIFNDCSWKHLGGSGLVLGTGVKNCLVSNSLFNDISGNGIMIGEGNDRLIGNVPWWEKAPGQVASENRVEHCSISEIGQQFFGAVGIWSGITDRTTLRYNRIFNLPYTGISAGWLWSAEPTPCRQLRIEGNHIHHIMQTLSDGGGIYTLGLQPGGLIVNNLIHDVEINTGKAESNGMFLDEGTTDMTIAGNIIYNIAKSPLRFHRATTNLVKENVLVCDEGIPPVRYNRTEEKDIIMEENRILSASDENDIEILQDIILNWESK